MAFITLRISEQFLSLSGRETLFQQTLLRVHSIRRSNRLISKILVVSNEEHRFIALEQFHEISDQIPDIPVEFLLEPVAKNTAPALTLAALLTQQNRSKDEDPILLVTPADQIIENQDAFLAAIEMRLLKLKRVGLSLWALLRYTQKQATDISKSRAHLINMAHIL